IRVFERTQNRLSSITPEGEMVIARAQAVLSQVRNIKIACEEINFENSQQLVIAITHTQARYFIPAVIAKFRAQYPQLPILMKDASPQQVIDVVSAGEVAIGIAVHAPAPRPDLLVLPCSRNEKIAIVPPGHPLLSADTLTPEALAAYPLGLQEKSSTTGKLI